ncbi:hypothetical protein, partial [Glaesserella parasuis]|uniref:hypothetical protein n=1 Tax=Glaesserella parasuis TaxID=738 RepID=UPI0024371F28
MNKLLLIFIAIFSVTACFEQPKKDIIQEKGEDKADVEGLKAEDSKVEASKVESPKVESLKSEVSEAGASQVKIPDSKKDITEASSSDEKAGARQSISVQNEQASVVDSNNENSLLAQDIKEPESQKSSKPKSLQYSINRHQES